MDSRQLADHLAFRDHLRTHPDTASAYAELKKTLAQRFGADRAAYTDAKTAFIDTVLRGVTRARSSAARAGASTTR